MKKRWLVLAFEICFLMLVLIIGPRGFLHLRMITKEILQAETKNKILEQEILELKACISAWKSDPFLKERFARENLHLAFPDEEVYYLETPAVG